MPTETKNYKLKKPQGNEYVSPKDFNENFDVIDSELKKRAELGEDGKVPAEQLPEMSSADHNHSAEEITAGTLAGQVKANATAATSTGTAQVRNISAGTTDLTAGSSALATGDIYFVYE